MRSMHILEGMRTLWRALTVLSFLVAIGTIGAAIHFHGTTKPETWNVIAASLAVLVAGVSALAAQEAVELQRNANAPYVRMTLGYDRAVAGGKAVALLNTGNTPAWDVWVSVQKPEAFTNFKASTRQLRPHESMSWEVPNSEAESTVGYLLTVSWSDGASRKFKERLEATEDDIRRIAITSHMDAGAKALTEISWQMRQIRELLQGRRR
jgi:hypothetical protein